MRLSPTSRSPRTARGTSAILMPLNSTRLKEQLRSLGQDRASEKTPGFVEFPWLGATPMPECILEAEDGDGGKLRIHLKGEAIAQAVSLGRMLWKG